MLMVLEETAHLRHHWIKDENPCVRYILENFPCLTDPQIVSNFTV